MFFICVFKEYVWVGRKLEFNATNLKALMGMKQRVCHNPQLCISVWWGALLLCFSVFLGVLLNLLILTVFPSMETQ